ncbi:PEP/pyruvate-binding domain-containing protein [Marinilabilia salmonicolor]|jgi:CheY-like chemotaxis protein|uniref:Response regulator receiver domain-containing protein n=1 Tax=Marinilabilia salmonicolor TaxID=989 RepID=A0A368UVJ8_9BACT|nr:PEP/pyruvate-binding domain-containing protein [Marinilabilia salmonicolor]RCW32693.1 response regulator receiver domain-containing protein [Marinilabilia salmonicolor]
MELNITHSRFSETAFDQLMQNRIHKVLLICSSYDAFMLEEDGRIDEQLFNEYVSLSLRYPPHFIQVSSAEEAFAVLEEEQIDLVITMLSVGGMDPFSLSRKIKEFFSQVPIVVLTPFSREVSLQLSREDTSAIDYVFCWLGNSNLLLAIIKLIEDGMNAEHDIGEVGVQSILLVEDSVRFYSSYLPLIYKIVFKQSKKFMHEGLNEHQMMMRMRGRPKILLARTYEEAEAFYDKYRNNLLGIISDVSFNHDGRKEVGAGVNLARKVKKDNPYMPFMLQSSDAKVAEVAKEMKVGFIHKHSKFLLKELRDFLNTYLAFGDFVFIDPKTGAEIDRVGSLRELQNKLMDLPDDSLHYHFKRDHVSKWLTARALFPIADVVRQLKVDDDANMKAHKERLVRLISEFRKSKSKGIIASFDRKRYDEYMTFSRIGQGSVGGKARGLAFLNTIIKRHSELNQHPEVNIMIPRTIVLGIDVFETFMEENDLYAVGLSDMSDEEILQHFIKGKLPAHLYADLLRFVQVVKRPVAVRSSSVLEDSHYQPFAGIYTTYMIAPSCEKQMVEQLLDAIKCVYASVYYKSSKAYMDGTMNLIDEERMGIVLQEVVGQAHENRFYPTFSGVARSVNFYPIPPEKAEDGVVNVALGLGRQIVEGGASLRFSPRYPAKVLQLSSPEMVVRETQKSFFALNLDATSFEASVNDGVNILKLNVGDAEKDGSLKWLASVFDMQNHMIKDGLMADGPRFITFANILKYDAFPLADIVNKVLGIGQDEMKQPVEIEFAVDLQTPDGKPVFYLLQIRPIVDTKDPSGPDLSDFEPEDCLIYSNSALGNGVVNDVQDIVYVKPETFKPSLNPEIARHIEKINDKLQKAGRPYLLVGPGRWGSQDPWLGVPVRWGQIAGARTIVEMGLENYHVEPSQGTHFFQNLTSLRVGYLTINPHIGEGNINMEMLNSHGAEEETDYVRHVHCSKPFSTMIDGKNNKGVVVFSE